MARTACLLALMSSLVPVVASAQGLRERVKTLGRDYVFEYRAITPDPGIETIVRESDTIVIGIVEASVSLLTQQETALETDHRIRVERVIRRTSQPALAIGDRVTVRCLGGAITIDGLNIVASVPEFPPLQTGATYVLMMRSVPGVPYLYLSYAGRGAFGVAADGKVRPTSQGEDTWVQEHGIVGLDVLLAEVQRILAKAP